MFQRVRGGASSETVRDRLGGKASICSTRLVTSISAKRVCNAIADGDVCPRRGRRGHRPAASSGYSRGASTPRGLSESRCAPGLRGNASASQLRAVHDASLRHVRQARPVAAPSVCTRSCGRRKTRQAATASSLRERSRGCERKCRATGRCCCRCRRRRDFINRGHDASAASLGVSARRRPRDRPASRSSRGRRPRRPGCAKRELSRHDDLFVEGPQVFQAAAAAANDQDIDRRRESIHQLDARGDLRRGAFALHAAPARSARRTPRQRRRSTSRKSAHRRAARAGDEGDAGAGILAAAVCAPDRTSPSAASRSRSSAQRTLERAEAFGLDLLNHELIAATRSVDVNIALADDFQSVVQIEPHTAGGHPPQDRAICALSSLSVR